MGLYRDNEKENVNYCIMFYASGAPIWPLLSARDHLDASLRNEDIC